MPRWVVKAHKWLSLIFSMLWLLQAFTGTLISFRGNIDDFMLGVKPTKIAPALLGPRIDSLNSDGSSVWSMWSSGGVPGQFDVYYTKDDIDFTLRVDGAGRELRHRPDSNLYSDGALFESLTQFHKNMFLGALGYTFFAISAVLLICNIILGFVYGLKHRKKLAKLAEVGKVGSVAQLKGLHWKVGYLGAPFALILVSFGIMLSYSDKIETWVGAGLPETPAEVFEGNAIDSAQALTIAGEIYGLDNLAAFKPINEYRNYYEVRVRVDGEMPRLYGASTIRIDGAGQVSLNFDASEADFGTSFSNSLYPAHTGQILGLPGRLVNSAIGIWMIAMIFLGVSSWFKRKTK